MFEPYHRAYVATAPTGKKRARFPEAGEEEVHAEPWFRVPSILGFRPPSTVLVEEVAPRKDSDKRATGKPGSEGRHPKVKVGTGGTGVQPANSPRGERLTKTGAAYLVRKLELSTEGFWDFLLSGRWEDTCLLRVLHGELLDKLLFALYSLLKDHDVISYVTVAKIEHQQPKKGAPCLKTSPRARLDYESKQVLVELDYFVSQQQPTVQHAATEDDPGTQVDGAHEASPEKHDAPNGMNVHEHDAQRQDTHGHDADTQNTDERDAQRRGIRGSVSRPKFTQDGAGQEDVHEISAADTRPEREEERPEGTAPATGGGLQSITRGEASASQVEIPSTIAETFHTTTDQDSAARLVECRKQVRFSSKLRRVSKSFPVPEETQTVVSPVLSELSLCVKDSGSDDKELPQAGRPSVSLKSADPRPSVRPASAAHPKEELQFKPPVPPKPRRPVSSFVRPGITRSVVVPVDDLGRRWYPAKIPTEPRQAFRPITTPEDGGRDSTTKETRLLGVIRGERQAGSAETAPCLPSPQRSESALAASKSHQRIHSTKTEQMLAENRDRQAATEVDTSPETALSVTCFVPGTLMPDDSHMPFQASSSSSSNCVQESASSTVRCNVRGARQPLPHTDCFTRFHMIRAPLLTGQNSLNDAAASLQRMGFVDTRATEKQPQRKPKEFSSGATFLGGACSTTLVGRERGVLHDSGAVSLTGVESRGDLCNPEALATSLAPGSGQHASATAPAGQNLSMVDLGSVSSRTLLRSDAATPITVDSDGDRRDSQRASGQQRCRVDARDHVQFDLLRKDPDFLYWGARDEQGTEPVAAEPSLEPLHDGTRRQTFSLSELQKFNKIIPSPPAKINVQFKKISSRAEEKRWKGRDRRREKVDESDSDVAERKVDAARVKQLEDDVAFMTNSLFAKDFGETEARVPIATRLRREVEVRRQTRARTPAAAGDTKTRQLLEVFEDPVPPTHSMIKKWEKCPTFAEFYDYLRMEEAVDGVSESSKEHYIDSFQPKVRASKASLTSDVLTPKTTLRSDIPATKTTLKSAASPSKTTLKSDTRTSKTALRSAANESETIPKPQVRQKLALKEDAISSAANTEKKNISRLPRLTDEQLLLIKNAGLVFSEDDLWHISRSFAYLAGSVCDNIGVRNALLQRREQIYRRLKEGKLILKLYESRLSSIPRRVPPSVKHRPSRKQKECGSSLCRKEGTSVCAEIWTPQDEVCNQQAVRDRSQNGTRTVTPGKNTFPEVKPKEDVPKDQRTEPNSQLENKVETLRGLSDEELPKNIPEKVLFKLMGFEEIFDARKLKPTYSFERMVAHRKQEKQNYATMLRKFAKKVPPENGMKAKKKNKKKEKKRPRKKQESSSPAETETIEELTPSPPPTPPMILGTLKEFGFLKYRDHVTSSITVDPLPRVMGAEEIRERLLQAMKTFIVRKERATTTHSFQSKVSVTFTRRHASDKDDLIIADGRRVVGGVCQTL